MRLVRLLTVLAVAAASPVLAQSGARGNAIPQAATKIDPWVLETGANGPTEFLVFLAEQADLRGADLLITKGARGRYVFDVLRDTANRTQGPLLDLLAGRGI